MQMYSKKSKSNFWIFGIAALLLTSAVILGFLFFNASKKLPSFLRSEHSDALQVSDQQKSRQAVVHYPDFESHPGLQALAENQARLLLNELTAQLDAFPVDSESVWINADYRTQTLSDRYLSVIYDIRWKIGESVTESASGYIIDQETAALAETSAFFDQEGLDRIAAGFRDAMKNQEGIHELAYSWPFIQATAPTAENYPSFYIDQGQLIFQFSAGSLADEKLSWTMPISQLGPHCLLMPEAQETELYIPPRTVDPSRPMIALTYDDGPHVKHTPEILSLLKEYGGAATFFMVGTRVELYPQIVLDIARSGSEAASHTYSHPNLNKLSGSALDFQLNQTTELVKELSGNQLTVQLLRPPYGAIDAEVKSASAYPLIMWNMDTLDWKTRDAAQTIDHVLNYAEDGDIILMHDIHAETADAAKTIIPKLTELGYQLVTVSELMEAKGITYLPGQKVFSASSVKD